MCWPASGHQLLGIYLRLFPFYLIPTYVLINTCIQFFPFAPPSHGLELCAIDFIHVARPPLLPTSFSLHLHMIHALCPFPFSSFIVLCQVPSARQLSHVHELHNRPHLMIIPGRHPQLNFLLNSQPPFNLPRRHPHCCMLVEVCHQSQQN